MTSSLGRRSAGSASAVPYSLSSISLSLAGSIFVESIVSIDVDLLSSTSTGDVVTSQENGEISGESFTVLRSLSVGEARQS